jgi:predicted ribosomally synthesized peptide with nif11-like leader
MSKESAESYLKRMKNDTAFAGRVTSCKDAKARAALVKAEGFEFTNDELHSLHDLNEKDLEGVVGGASKPHFSDCGGYQGAECC